MQISRAKLGNQLLYFIIIKFLACFCASKAGHRSTLRPCVFAFWHCVSVYVRLSAFLCGDKSSTCVCLRLMSVARVAHVLLLRFVAGNMDVDTLASKRSELIRNCGDCSKVPRNPQKVDLCVLASFSCRGNAGTQGSICGRLNE